MQGDQQRKYDDLAEKWLNGTITQAEAKEYADWYNIQTGEPLEIPSNLANSENELKSSIFNHITAFKNSKKIIPIVHRIHLLRTAWFKYASIIIIVSCIGAYLYFNPLAGTTGEIVQQQVDIPAPSIVRATLTLADGQVVFLDTASIGNVASQANVDIEKLKSGDLVYRSKGETSMLQYNILSVPKGSQVAKIVLSDGSKVYLNAASSIRYPVIFSEGERRVELTGEAYFEISKNAHKRFIVESKGTTTEVLGTHFNVNSYADEENGIVTLVEGSVRVRKHNESIVIKPGEQIITDASNKLKVNPKANLGQVLAWQKGIFVFTDMSLQSILRQVERWYNVAVKYEGNIPSVSYGGGLSRKLPLSEVILLLKSDKIDIKLERNILIVKSK